MSETMNKLTRLQHLVDLGTRTKGELNALDAKIQEIVTIGGQPNVIEEIWLNGVKQTVARKRRYTDAELCLYQRQHNPHRQQQHHTTHKPSDRKRYVLGQLVDKRRKPVRNYLHGQ